ncbi:MAG: succinate dehydrogenase/fumarate reductase cytochrome b subunit [Porphyromonadaceae bacterium CG2_30_38_12]|nr:MAG: succinate dehydrogenase/fumarate reductase cytochrome b subunit [Porphyromonadaceae bacterium CG2_30_38_12]
MWLIDSSIGRKLIMSITGIFLVLFLVFHGTMNFVVLFSAEAYNAIAGFLGANWYALVGTKLLAIGFVVHIIYAIYLSFQNQKARGGESYAVKNNQKSVEWASQNMLVLGVIVLGFMALHLFQFWSKMQLVEISHKLGLDNGGDLALAKDGAYWVKHYFENPVYSVLYIIWLVALWMHLTHGIWSAFQTMGAGGNIWLPRIKVISSILATLIILMFISIPVYFLLGFSI